MGVPKVTWEMVPSKLEERSIPEPNSGCWIWTSYTNKKGYGQIVIEGTLYISHRVSWKIFRGEIPAGMNVLHRCDNPPCINPDHLFLGTHADNVKDREKKGRGSAAYGHKQHLSKLTNEDVAFIYQSDLGQKKLAKKFGVTRQAIYSILTGRSWSWMTKELK